MGDIQKKGKWTRLVKFIRESHPRAWPGVRGGLRDPTQVGKVVKINMERIIKLRKERRTFVRNSGISGPQLTLMEKHVDEIILHDPPTMRNEEDYISTQATASSRSVAEKRRHGEMIRDAVIKLIIAIPLFPTVIPSECVQCWPQSYQRTQD